MAALGSSDGYSESEAQPPGAHPPPRGLERAASKVADFTAFVRAGASLEAAKRTAEMVYLGYLLSLGLARQDAASQPGAVAIAVGGLLAIVVGSVLVKRRVKSELAVLSTHAHDGLRSPTARLRRAAANLRVLRSLLPPSRSASVGANADLDAETDAQLKPRPGSLTAQDKRVDAGMGHPANTGSRYR